MSPMSATMRPTQKLHTNIRTIPMMTMIPPAEIPADPRRRSDDPAMRISLQRWMQSISLPAPRPPQAPPRGSQIARSISLEADRTSWLNEPASRG